MESVLGTVRQGNRLKTIRWVQVIFATLINDPEHAMLVNAANGFIDVPDHDVFTGQIAETFFIDADNKSHSHLFTFILTLPIPCASYQCISANAREPSLKHIMATPFFFFQFPSP